MSLLALALPAVLLGRLCSRWEWATLPVQWAVVAGPNLMAADRYNWNCRFSNPLTAPLRQSPICHGGIVVQYCGSVWLVDPTCALRTAQSLQCFSHRFTFVIVIAVVDNITEHKALSASHTQFEARPMSEERKGTPPPADEPVAEAPAVAAAAEAGQPARELPFCCSCVWPLASLAAHVWPSCFCRD